MLKLPETTVRQTKKNSQFRIRGGSVAIWQKDSVVLAQSLEVSSQGRESEAVNMEEGRSGCLSVGPEIIFIFPRSLTMKMSENWRDLRPLKPKFRGIRFVGTEALIISWKSQFDPLRSVVIAQSQIFLELDPDLVTWPDLNPKILENVGNECPLKVKFSACYLQPLNNGTPKTWGGLWSSPFIDLLHCSLHFGVSTIFFWQIVCTQWLFVIRDFHRQCTADRPVTVGARNGG